LGSASFVEPNGGCSIVQSSFKALEFENILCLFSIGKFQASVTVHHEYRWRDKDQQDAAYMMFISNLTQHVSGIIMPIIRRYN